MARRTLPLTAIVIVIAALLTVSTFAVLLRLRHGADASRVAQIELGGLESQLMEVSAAEWRMIADRPAGPESVTNLQRARAAAASLVVELGHRYSGLEQVDRRVREYSHALDLEIAAVRGGDYEAAHTIDAEAVDPAFALVVGAISSSMAEYDAAAIAINRRTDVYFGLALSVTALVGALLFIALHRARSNVDELRRAEQLIQESERRYRRLFEDSRDPIYVTDAGGRIFDANRAATEQSGRPLSDLLGRTFSELLQDQAVAVISPPETSSAGASERAVTMRRGDDTTAECLVTSSARHDDDGNHVGWQIFVRDVTEQNTLQRQFEQAQKMEVVGRLAGGVAHDFNNVLTIVLGHGALMVEQLSEGHPLRGHVEMILQAAKRATSLTRQLLAFSRKQMLNREIVDINAVVKATLEMLRPLLGEHVELRRLQAPIVRRIEIDTGQVAQVLMNLAVNARDAMPGGGVLTIETREVVLDAEYARTHAEVVPGPHVMLAVGDTGVGMSREVQSRVFEPFFTTKPTSKGTGLGLATVYGIVKQSGGHIVVHSEVGHGSTFRIYFPSVEERAVVEAARQEAGVVAAGREAILVVEDDAGVRVLARENLARHGYTVYTAENGDEALRLCAGTRIDLLLTDVVMPGMDGHTLALQVRRAHPDVKILYMSGYTGDVMADRDLRDRGTVVLQKPFEAARLAQEVRRRLDGGPLQA